MKLKSVLSVLLLVACGGGDDRGRDIGDLGAVCGSASIIGVPVSSVSSSVSRQCGISWPVRLYEVAGVTLRERPLVNCPTARALEAWVRRGIKPAVRDIGAQLASMRVVAHYACRTRNNRPGGRVSEHGKGNAIDIAAFGLNGGDEISVSRDWGRGAKGQALLQIQSAACGPFGVVLGPGSDGFHEDHLHVDISNIDRPFCK